MYGKFVRNLKRNPLPPNDRWHQRVDRQSEFGNPFKISEHIDREAAVRLFATAVLTGDERAPSLESILALKGKYLYCHCAPQLCHAHVVACLANEPDGPARTMRWLGW